MTMIAVLFFADVIALNTNVFLLVHKKWCTQRRSFFSSFSFSDATHSLLHLNTKWYVFEFFLFR